MLHPQSLVRDLTSRSCFSLGSWRSLSTTRPHSSPPFRVLLLGSDAFSCATLEALNVCPSELVESITVTTPARARSGRGLKLGPECALYLRAQSLGLSCSQLPHTGFVGWSLPDAFTKKSPSNILVAASFGYMIPSSILELFEPLNALNVHPSNLPKYRGAAPIQWAIINRDKATGVSVQELSKGKFDRGRLLGQRTVPIPAGADFKTLEPLLAKEGAELLVATLRNLKAAQLSATLQDSARASSAPKITKEHARVDWSSTRLELVQLQRGISHQLPLWTTFSSPSPSASPTPIQLELDFSPVPESVTTTLLLASNPGTVALDRSTKPSQLLVRCGSEAMSAVARIARVKLPGGKWISGNEWSRARDESNLAFA